MVSKDLGVGENGAKAWVVIEYSLACPIIKLQKNIFELGDHVREKALNLNLPPKLGLVKNTPLASFPNHLLENV